MLLTQIDSEMDTNPEKARVLLYKGRLEDEMDNRKEAVKNYHDVLMVLNKYPDEKINNH